MDHQVDIVIKALDAAEAEESAGGPPRCQPELYNCPAGYPHSDCKCQVAYASGPLRLGIVPQPIQHCPCCPANIPPTRNLHVMFYGGGPPNQC